MMKNRTHKGTMRLLLITIGVLALAMAAAGVAAAAVPDREDAPQFDKKVFVHHGKGHQPASGGNGGGGGSCKVNDGGQSWFNLPINLEVNPSGSGVNDATAVGSVQTGFQAWEDALGQDLINPPGHNK